MAGLTVPETLSGPFVNSLQLFPEEVWRQIFGKLKDPKDLFSVMYSTEEWYGMLKPERNLFLFPQVLEILDKRGLLKVDNRRDLSQVDSQNPLEPMLKCRLVCKSWDKAVQDYIQLHPKYFSMDDENDGSNYYCSPSYPAILNKLTYYFSSKEDMDDFLEAYGATHSSSERNPFLTRRVDIDDSENQGCVGEYFKSLMLLLLKYGRHIYHLALHLERKLTPITYYRMLEEILDQTPNVRTLKLCLDLDGDYEEGHQELARLAVRIQLAPLPKLEHLVFLKTSDLPSATCQHLLERNGNIEKLVIRNSSECAARYDMAFSLVNLRNLREWFIDVRSGEDLAHLESKFPAGGNGWPVKTLYVNCGDEFLLEDEDDWADWGRVFRVVEQSVGQTLTNLRLKLTKPPEDYWDTGSTIRFRATLTLRLNLPQLKQLRVRIPFLSSIDFLLPLDRTLEELVIVVHQGSGETLKAYYKSLEKIKFNGLFDRMEASNIWGKLPQLRMLDVIVITEEEDDFNDFGGYVYDPWNKSLTPEPPVKYSYEKQEDGSVKKREQTRFNKNVIFSN